MLGPIERRIQMKIATGIAVAGFILTLAIAVDPATRYVDENRQSYWVEGATQVPEQYRNKDNNSVTRPDMRDGKKSPEAFKRADGSGSTTTYPVEFYDRLLRQRAREDKINALNARCNGNSSALCRKHNDRPAEKFLPLSGRAEALSS
jgi:hypothetical protein